MRLFVAAWPAGQVVDGVASAVDGHDDPGLRWVERPKWHVTLDFLGSVDDERASAAVDAIARVGAASPPARAVLGPETSLLGRSVLCAPVAGLDELARSVREAMAPINASPDRDRPFVGHLTLARAQRRGSIPRRFAGIALSGSWLVETIALMSSVSDEGGSRYETVGVAMLSG